MAATAVVEVAGRTVTVRELTVAEVRDWVREVEIGVRPIDPAGDALFEDVCLGDMALMSDASGDFLAGFGPSELQPLADLCKKVNPHFFRLRAVVQAAQAAQVHAILSAHQEPPLSATAAP